MKAICQYCGNEVGGIFTLINNGKAHVKCYLEANPPKPAKTLRDVIWNDDEQWLIAELLEKHVNLETKQLIINEFNLEKSNEHEKRMGKEIMF